MNESELNELRALRQTYDDALNVCDPVTYALRQQHLLHHIAEFIIKPLQEYEMAQRAKFEFNEPMDEEG